MRTNPSQETQSPELPTHTVCGRAMTTDPGWYPRAPYQGRTITFCTEFCLETFESDPDRFYAAHSRNRSQEAAQEAQPARGTGAI